MKRILLVICTVALLAADKKPKEKRQPDPEDRWACRLENGYHKCSCVAMTSEVQQSAVEKCQQKYGGPPNKDYTACIGAIPGHCSIVQEKDSVHPEHTCQRSCTRARCRCSDGPPCFGPSLIEPPPSSGSDDNNPEIPN